MLENRARKMEISINAAVDSKQRIIDDNIDQQHGKALESNSKPGQDPQLMLQSYASRKHAIEIFQFYQHDSQFVKCGENAGEEEQQERRRALAVEKIRILRIVELKHWIQKHCETPAGCMKKGRRTKHR